MSKLTDGKYEGDMLDGWHHGKGKYYYANGVVYEGDFFKGEFHGEGILIYPNGVNSPQQIIIFLQGRYKSNWERGKMMQGDYYFEDTLKYEFQEWQYCTGEDKRFYQEINQGIKPSGATQKSRDDRLAEGIPEGTYGNSQYLNYYKDVGQGYYEPIKSIIYCYDGSILRTPSEQEAENIVQKCRYNPRLDLVIAGENDKVIKKLIEKNNKVKD